MKIYNENQISKNMKIKSFFYDLLANEKENKNFSVFTQSLLNFIKEELTALYVNLYKFNNWKEKFVLEASTNHEVVDKEVILEDWNILKKDNTNVFKGSSLCKTGLNENSFIGILKGDSNDQEIGWLEIALESEQTFEEKQDLFSFITSETANLLDRWNRLYGVSNEEARYEQLYRVTAKFHSSMDMDEVLEEIIHTLKEVYPSFEYFLLLSHDNNNLKNLPIRDLQYGTDSTNPGAAQAYLTGNVQFEDSLIDGRSVLYAPLKGKQGIYGVLQVMAPNTLVFPEEEIGFIELLANTAGSALEDAQLYQQSKRLISDLQLINKTSHRLNSNLRLSESINFMSQQITKSFKAEEVGFVIFSHGTYEVLQGSSAYFESQASEKFLLSLNEKIKEEEDSLFIGDLSSDLTIIKDGFRSLMAVPMVQSGILKGVVYVLHHNPYQFTFENFKLLQSLIHHSTLAFTNAMLREELEKLVITDHLTKLYSRNYLDERIQNSMEYDSFGTFLLIDIDNFKNVNDTFGHQVGDEVIIQVANIIKSNIRENDIGARWGGEELAVYLPKIDFKTGLRIGERLVKIVERESEPKVTISCGASYWSFDRNDTVKELFNRADEALYKAKQQGKNRVVVHEDNKTDL